MTFEEQMNEIDMNIDYESNWNENANGWKPHYNESELKAGEPMEVDYEEAMEALATLEREKNNIRGE